MSFVSVMLCRPSVTHMSVNLTVRSAAMIRGCIATAPQSASIFHATTYSTTVNVTGHVTVPSACLTAGTAKKKKSRHAIRTTIRTASSIMAMGSVTRAAMCVSVCGTVWIAIPTVASPQDSSSSSLQYRQPSLPTFGRRSCVRSVTCCTVLLSLPTMRKATR